MIRPIPSSYGVGFVSAKQLPEYAGKYREENIGRYWNYHVTANYLQWPKSVDFKGPYIIDGFSPNLNKTLHVGHLRQLALAKSLSSILNFDQKRAKFVSLMGASQGVFQYAQKQLGEWFDFLDFHPTLYYDVLMPLDQEVVPRRKTKVLIKDTITTDFNGKPFEHEEECEVWDGPKGPVIVVRSNGRPLYAYSDIAFAKTVGPTHYITGSEQKEHFSNLGLGDKHLSMGLVLGEDGKKIKSRTGDSITAIETMQLIEQHLNPTSEPKKLAWNILAWNFLHISRSSNVKFTPEQWTKSESPGMYITYTYARITSVLETENISHVNSNQLNEDDIKLLGFAGQHAFYMQHSIDALDPAILANYTHELAMKINVAYHSEQIKGGRLAFKYAIYKTVITLRDCMLQLGMFPLESV